jgi:hypothetical protein
MIRRALPFAVVGIAAIVVTACSDPASSQPESVAVTHEDLTVVCLTSIACCESGSVALSKWDTADPFQAQLASWGCSKPRLYAPSWSANQWWYVSTCSDDGQRVQTFLASHPVYQQAPYLAYTATKLDPQCVQGAPQGNTYVLWDPTCSTCSRIQ